MSKRDDLKAEMTTGTPAPAPKAPKKTPTATGTPAPKKNAPTTGPLTSAELYAHVDKLAEEIKSAKAHYKELVANADACLEEARKLEIEEQAAAKAEARAKAKAEATIDGANYTGMVFIPWWSEDGKLCLGLQPDIKK